MQTRSIDGATIVVTGATSGIGYFVASALAQRGASIIVAARSAERAATMIGSLPGTGVHRHLPFDLSDRASVEAAGDLLGRGGAVDGLVCNAGIIAPPVHRETGSFGVERSVDLNLFAHVELFRRARPALERAEGARIVWFGSNLTTKIPFDPDDWLSQRSYRPRGSYAMSKHATELFGFELDRRLRGASSSIRSIVTHPGSAIDALTPDHPGGARRATVVRALAPAARVVFGRVVQGKDAAAAAAVTALTVAEVGPGDYFGPSNGLAGAVGRAAPVATSLDPELGAAVWREVEMHLGQSLIE